MKTLDEFEADRLRLVQKAIERVVTDAFVDPSAVLHVVKDAATFGTGVLAFRGSMLRRLAPTTYQLTVPSSDSALVGLLHSVGLDPDLPHFRDQYWHDPIFHALTARLQYQQAIINDLKRDIADLRQLTGDNP